MKKKIYLFCTLLISTIIASFVWKITNLPVSSNLDLQGWGEYFKKNYNSNNDTIRFFLFILISLIPFLLTYLHFYKNNNYNLKSIFFIKENEEKNVKVFKINWLFNFFLICVFLEFLLIKFETFISPLDIFHEGLWLTSSLNYTYTNNFWLSSYVDRGLFGNFFPLILWKTNGIISIGSARFFELLLILFYKIFLLCLAKQITDNVNFDKLRKILFFSILAIIFLSLSDYTDSRPYSRTCLLLLFLSIFFISLKNTDKLNFSNFLLGAFSLVSMIWYIDIGAYINILIFVIIIFFLIRKNYKYIFSIILGILFSWTFFYIVISGYEFESFVNNTITIFSTIDQISGRIHPVPFFSDDSRATKTIIFFIITGVFVINICFNKSNNVSNNGKIFFIFFYLSSLIVYKSALSTSDSGHIRVSSEIVILLLSTFIVYYFIALSTQEKLKKKFSILNKKFTNLISVTTLLLIIIFNLEIYKIKNIPSVFKKIDSLMHAPDKEFLSNSNPKKWSEFVSNEYNELIVYYKNLTKDEDCVQIFTDEQAIPYLMRKKTCTNYYQMLIAEPKKIQENFVNQLQIKKPKIILYKSERVFWVQAENRLPIVNLYLEKNYEFHSKFKYWTFIKLKNVN